MPPLILFFVSFNINLTLNLKGLVQELYILHFPKTKSFWFHAHEYTKKKDCISHKEVQHKHVTELDVLYPYQGLKSHQNTINMPQENINLSGM
jgi:hypothetical protein